MESAHYQDVIPDPFPYPIGGFLRTLELPPSECENTDLAYQRPGEL